ncbi:hypothetical protein BJ912DRAFT_929383 [Pholiota molesta]|nr:hypothetical protein BJ912DRAFT_929383 [Pholiota molesta]
MARKSPATKTTKRSLPRRLRGIPNSEVRFAHDIPRVRPTIRAEVSPVADSQEDFASDVPPDAGSSGDTPTAYNATRQRGNPLWDSYSRVDAQVAPSGFQQYATQRQDDRYGSYLAAASAENDLPQYAFQTEGDGQNPQAYRTPYAWDPTDSAGQDLRTFNDYDGHLVDNSTSRFVGPEFALAPTTVNYEQGDALYWPHQEYIRPPLSSANQREDLQYTPPGFHHDATTNWAVPEPASSGSTSLSEDMRYGDGGAYYFQSEGSWQSGNAN